MKFCQYETPKDLHLQVLVCDTIQCHSVITELGKKVSKVYSVQNNVRLIDYFYTFGNSIQTKGLEFGSVHRRCSAALMTSVQYQIKDF